MGFAAVIAGLEECRVNLWKVSWIEATIMDRIVALRLGSWTSEPTLIFPGLKQGNSRSPALFNIYTTKVDLMTSSGFGKVLTFTDDILINRMGFDRKINCVKMFSKHCRRHPNSVRILDQTSIMIRHV